MKGIRFRPEQTGLRTSLFDLEAEIMEVVWSEGWETFAVAQVHRILEGRRKIAYTTVMTTVSRLFEKGLVGREREGRRYLYHPLMTRAAFIETATREVLQSLPPVGKETAMAMLMDQVAEGNGDELDRLEAMIQARRANGKI